MNRDELGGTLRGIAKRLDERLRAGAARVVLDNTYVTRSVRSEIVRLAQLHGASLRCIWFDTPPHEAQRNLILRILDRHAALPIDLAKASREDPAVLAPSALVRMLRELELPTKDEGFDDLEMRAFTRVLRGTRVGTAISRAALAKLDALPGEGPILVYEWAEMAPLPVLDTDRLYEHAVCGHPAGAPTCWCRPPLPGLWLAFAARHDLVTEKSLLVGTTPADSAMAEHLGMTYTAI